MGNRRAYEDVSMKEIFTKAVAHFITLPDDVDATTLAALPAEK